MHIELDLTTHEYATLIGCLVFGTFEPGVDSNAVEEIIIKISKNEGIKPLKEAINGKG